MNRMVQRVHASTNGWAGNDTKLDLWHGTIGQYAGLDRFGRTTDMKFTEYSGSPVEFDRRTYTYDRMGNPTDIDNKVYKHRSMDLTYDNLNRLRYQTEGFDDSGTVSLSSVTRDYDFDLLGNFTSAAGGFKQNSAPPEADHADPRPVQILPTRFRNPPRPQSMNTTSLAEPVPANRDRFVAPWLRRFVAQILPTLLRVPPCPLRFNSFS
jgi:hypothetical protein